jgi:hypothetical protein
LVGSAPRILAADCVPSPKVSRMDAASFTTCRAVKTTPRALAMTPVPVVSNPLLFGLAASMATTEGARAR